MSERKKQSHQSRRRAKNKAKWIQNAKEFPSQARKAVSLPISEWLALCYCLNTTIIGMANRVNTLITQRDSEVGADHQVIGLTEDEEQELDHMGQFLGDLRALQVKLQAIVNPMMEAL